MYWIGVILNFIIWTIVYVKLDFPRELMGVAYMTCFVSWILIPAAIIVIVLHFILTLFFDFLDKLKKK